MCLGRKEWRVCGFSPGGQPSPFLPPMQTTQPGLSKGLWFRVKGLGFRREWGNGSWGLVLGII